jgi:outer membrane protein
MLVSCVFKMKRRSKVKSFKMFILALSILGLVTTVSFAQNTGKIAYCDLSRLFDEYYKTKDYDKVLEGKSKDYEKERNDKIAKIKDSQGKLAALADDKKAPVESEIEKLKTELLEYDRQKKTELTKERNDKIREILLEIEKIVSGYAEKNGFSLILNDRVLIYGNQTLDQTEALLKILNANQPAAATDKK